MSDLKFFPVANDFVVKIEEFTKEPLPHFVLNRIEDIWNQEKEMLGSVLFNGQLLSMVNFDEHRLVGRIVEYKHYIAQKRDLTLKPYLDITPLGVSVRTFSGNSLLMGRRSHKVFLHRDKLECVPSGGVDLHAREEDHINMRRQVEIELHEETGLPASTIQTYSLLGIVSSEGICEICVELILDPALEKTDLLINDEYSKFFWIPKDELGKFKTEHAHEIIDVSQFLLSSL